jgi:hypothetical protein
MIEILKNGTIVISLGIAGCLFILYIILEAISIKWKSISFLHSIIIYLIYLQRFKKTIPVGWTNKTKIYDFGSIRKFKSNRTYTIIQHLDSEIEEKRICICSRIHIDWLGRIVENDLPEVCKKIEETMDQAKIKSFKREKSLKDIGI